jgi:hypothetical protein
MLAHPDGIIKGLTPEGSDTIDVLQGWFIAGLLRCTYLFRRRSDGDVGSLLELSEQGCPHCESRELILHPGLGVGAKGRQEKISGPGIECLSSGVSVSGGCTSVETE